MNHKPLKSGEEFLSISLFNGQIRLVAFPNKNREEGQPHYTGNGIAVWKRKKK